MAQTPGLPHAWVRKIGHFYRVDLEMLQKIFMLKEEDPTYVHEVKFESG